jgi:chromosome segregation ATPase
VKSNAVFKLFFLDLILHNMGQSQSSYEKDGMKDGNGAERQSKRIKVDDDDHRLTLENLHAQEVKGFKKSIRHLRAKVVLLEESGNQWENRAMTAKETIKAQKKSIESLEVRIEGALHVKIEDAIEKSSEQLKAKVEEVNRSHVHLSAQQDEIEKYIDELKAKAASIEECEKKLKVKTEEAETLKAKVDEAKRAHVLLRAQQEVQFNLAKAEIQKYIDKLKTKAESLEESEHKWKVKAMAAEETVNEYKKTSETLLANAEKIRKKFRAKLASLEENEKHWKLKAEKAAAALKMLAKEIRVVEANVRLPSGFEECGDGDFGCDKGEAEREMEEASESLKCALHILKAYGI